VGAGRDRGRRRGADRCCGCRHSGVSWRYEASWSCRAQELGLRSGLCVPEACLARRGRRCLSRQPDRSAGVRAGRSAARVGRKFAAVNLDIARGTADFGSPPSAKRWARPSDGAPASPHTGEPKAADSRAWALGCFDSHSDRGRDPHRGRAPFGVAGHEFADTGQCELRRECEFGRRCVIEKRAVEFYARARSRRTRRAVRTWPPRLSGGCAMTVTSGVKSVASHTTAGPIVFSCDTTGRRAPR
jgi:hypothetical protein